MQIMNGTSEPVDYTTSAGVGCNRLAKWTYKSVPSGEVTFFEPDKGCDMNFRIGAALTPSGNEIALLTRDENGDRTTMIVKEA